MTIIGSTVAAYDPDLYAILTCVILFACCTPG